jgi:hypothetical protein
MTGDRWCCSLYTGEKQCKKLVRSWDRTKGLWSVKVWTSNSFQRVMDSVHNPTTAPKRGLRDPWLESVPSAATCIALCRLQSSLLVSAGNGDNPKWCCDHHHPPEQKQQSSMYFWLVPSYTEGIYYNDSNYITLQLQNYNGRWSQLPQDTIVASLWSRYTLW